MKKNLKLCLCLLCCAVMLTGCNKKVEEEPKKTTPSEPIQEESKEQSYTLTDTEQQILEIIDLYVSKENSMSFNELSDEKKTELLIDIAFHTSTVPNDESLYGEILNKETLTEIMNYYFGPNATVELTDYNCECKVPIYLYNKDTGKYSINPEHYGHGGVSQTKFKKLIDTTIKDNKVYIKYKIIFSNLWGEGDGIYAFYKDSTAKDDLKIEVKNYCTENLGDNMYAECDGDAVIDAVQDSLSTLTYEFIKENDKFYFNKLTIE